MGIPTGYPTTKRERRLGNLPSRRTPSGRCHWQQPRERPDAETSGQSQKGGTSTMIVFSIRIDRNTAVAIGLEADFTLISG